MTEATTMTERETAGVDLEAVLDYLGQQQKPVAALLVACAREDVPGGELAGLLDAADLDPDELTRVAELHGMLPMLHRQLHARGRRNCAPSLGDRVRSAFMEHGLRSRSLTGELIRLMEVLRRADVRVLAWNGPVLGQDLYGDFALRQFADLDLIVDPSELEGAKAVMAALGYDQVAHLTGGRGKPEHALRFVRHGGRVVVELHWAVAPGYFGCEFGFGGLWDRRRTVNTAGVDVDTLSREDLFLVLCLHGQRHNWLRLEWVCGVARLMGETLDWRSVVERARELGLLRIVAVSSVLAHEVLGAELSGWLLRVVAEDDAARPLAGKLAGWLFSDSAMDDGFERDLLPISARERFTGRIRYGWHGLNFTAGVAVDSVLGRARRMCWRVGRDGTRFCDARRERE